MKTNMTRSSQVIRKIAAVVFFAWTITVSVGAATSNRTIEELIKWLRDEYDSSIRPNVTGGPVIVYVESYISSFGAINEENMEFSLDMFFRQRWKDERFAYRPIPEKGPDQRLNLNPKMTKLPWRPDLFFKNSKKASFHYVPTENILFGIRPEGDVILSTRITTTLACNMNFRRFPMDHQECKFQLGSYANTDDDVIVRWSTGKGIIMSDEVEIPHFILSQIITKNTKGVYNTGTYSEPEAVFYLKRRIVFYLYGFYLPVTLVVLLSWVSFWIDPTSTPARVSLGVITILAMGNFLHGGKSSPQVSYATAMDVYVITCFMFVFASLLEFAAVHCGINSDEKTKVYKPCVLTKITGANDNFGQNNEDIKETTGSGATSNAATLPVTSRRKSILALRDIRPSFGSQTHYFRFNAKSVEKFSRVFFPLSFAVFNVVYWTIYFS